jgi:hypothetical protein
LRIPARQDSRVDLPDPFAPSRASLLAARTGRVAPVQHGRAAQAMERQVLRGQGPMAHPVPPISRLTATSASSPATVTAMKAREFVGGVSRVVIEVE